MTIDTYSSFKPFLCLAVSREHKLIFVLKMNSRKKGTGSEVNITLTMIWCQIVIQLVHMSKF
jgi:hypothetical protein